MEKSKERKQRQGYIKKSGCFKSKALRNDLDMAVELRWTSGQPCGFQGVRIQMAGLEKRALLQAPNKSLVLAPKWKCFPDFNKVSSGGLALRHVVTIQKT